MKLEDVFFFGGLVFIGYWLTKKNATIITSEALDTKPFAPIEDVKTIVLDLSQRSRGSNLFDESFFKDYDSSIKSTVSPQRVHVKSDF
jgi:hypothetical protein